MFSQEAFLGGFKFGAICPQACMHKGKTIVQVKSIVLHEGPFKGATGHTMLISQKLQKEMIPLTASERL